MIGALATTAGFLAFVAATGAAITWVELSAAQLPADRALQVIPESALITTGQIALTLFAIVGVIAVAPVYARRHRCGGCRGLGRGLERPEVAQAG